MLLIAIPHRTAAGSNFASYGIGHAGLGVWDTTEDNKYTIEFVSETYEGSLLPDVGTNSLTWNNAGKIVISSPLDDDLWLNARLIATTSGNAYSQLITYLQDDIGTKYDYYQPVTALYVNASLVNTSSGDISNTDVSSIGSIKVNAINSFSFVDDLIYQLSTYGIDLGAFLSIYATSFNYFTRPDTVPTVVSSSHADVLAWFTALDACYNSNFNAVLQSGAGAQAFLTSIRDCYGSYAYVFASPVAVYNVSRWTVPRAAAALSLTRLPAADATQLLGLVPHPDPIAVCVQPARQRHGPRPVAVHGGVRHHRLRAGQRPRRRRLRPASAHAHKNAPTHLDGRQPLRRARGGEHRRDAGGPRVLPVRTPPRAAVDRVALTPCPLCSLCCVV